MRIFVFTLLMSSFVGNALSQSQRVVLWKRNYDAAYMHAAVSNILALSEDKFGKVELISSVKTEQGRAFANTANGAEIDIFIGAINTDREARATPLFVPIDRGLLGIRLCLVHAKTPPFSNIQSVDDLRKQNIIFGFGSHWPDKTVFVREGLQTVSSPVYESLFNMLIGNRFDCFARSLPEIGLEIDQRRHLPLKVESHLALIYPSAEFMFVNNSNIDLQERLKYGLARAIENGSFFRIFDQHHQKTIEKHQLESRRNIYLENTDISEKALNAIMQYGLEGLHGERTQDKNTNTDGTTGIDSQGQSSQNSQSSSAH
ncbi:hypothetical protein ACFO4O_14160 [Glaciecola siphonariae]|uniref:Solute-binding protein family 3/N-terminal domain-containing protein n=1 Tax=Glaciecola siphonariae TaxID=521012 RepID=A0ABV9LYD0_9ALTE